MGTGSSSGSSWLNRPLDLSILFSFDRSGFRRHARSFDSPGTPPEVSGKVCLVTGANSGIGRATALSLARGGAQVWLLCRDRDRGREAREDLRRRTGNPEVHLSPVDLSDLESVAAAAGALGRKRVDVLVHNAGGLMESRRESPQGIELTFATHLAGPHLLTRLLLPALKLSEDPRVIWVSSGGMYLVPLNLRDPFWVRRSFNGVRAYAEVKRAQVLLSGLWSERAEAEGVAFHAMHPGWVETPGLRRSLPGFARALGSRLRTPDQGADTVVWLASTRAPLQPRSGGFWFDRRPAPTEPLPGTRVERCARLRLWELCERITEAPGGSTGSRRRGIDASLESELDRGGRVA